MLLIGLDMVPDGELSHHSKEVAKGSFWSFLGNAFYKLISFFYVVLLARAASQDDVGLFFLSFSIVGIIMMFSDFGLPNSLQRFVPFFEGRDERGKILSLLNANYLIVTVAGIIFTAALFSQADNIGLIYKNQQLPDAIRILSPLILFGSIFKIHIMYLQGRAAVREMQFMQNMQNFLKLALTAGLFYLFGPSAVTIAAGLVLSNLVLLPLSQAYVNRSSAGLEAKSVSLSDEELRDLLPFGFLLSVINSIAVIIVSYDKILLGYLAPPETASQLVAIYSIATTLSLVLTMFPYSIEVIFFPTISRLVGKNDFQQIREATDTAQRWSLMVTIPIAVAMILASEELLVLIYGPAYRAGALAMSITTLGFMIRAFSSALSITLAAMRKLKLEFVTYLIVALSNLLFGLLLIPSYGMEGAAAASVIGFCLMLLLFAYYSHKAFGFSFKPGILKLALCGLLAFTLVLIVKTGVQDAFPGTGGGADAARAPALLSLSIVSGLSLAAFCAFVIAARCLHKEDVALLGTVLRKARLPQPLSQAILKTASLGVHG
ncbi:MAG: flippase [Candidatus Micrarchaeia archaeon]